MTGGELLPIVSEGAAKVSGSIGETIGGTLSDVWQGVLGHKVAAWQIKRAIDANECVHAYAKERGVVPNLEQIPERYAYGWFSKVTQEDEPEIQKLFAKLLVHAAEGNEDALYRRHIDIVSQLTPNDAKLFALFSTRFEERERRAPTIQRTRIDLLELNRDLISKDGFNDERSFDALLSMELFRVTMEIQVDDGAIARTASRSLIGQNVPRIASGIRVKNFLVQTGLGKSLAKALKPPG